MNRYIFYALTVIASLSACSQSDDDVPVPGQEENVIRFSAQAPKQSRAASVTTATLQNFIVYAFTDSELIMDGVTVTRNGGSWTYSPAVYWPSTPVSFYAVSPDLRTGSSTTNFNNLINDVTMGNSDLIYAVNMNQYESPTPVNLSFRHAMSRVAVNLSCSNENYKVKVDYVVLKNIALFGDFSLPNATTSPTNSDAVGTWSNLSDRMDRMIYYFDVAPSPLILNPTPVDVTEGNMEQSFCVPQELLPFSFTNSGVFSGSYIEIDCEIFDKFTGEKLWPTEHTPQYLLVDQTPDGRMLFPLATNTVTSWEPGYSYIYNIKINTSYSIDTIEFNPSVTDYIDVTAY